MSHVRINILNLPRREVTLCNMHSNKNIQFEIHIFLKAENCFNLDVH